MSSTRVEHHLSLRYDHLMSDSAISAAAHAARVAPVAEDNSGHGASLHGENAARRQAITELLFFASVGDVLRCKKICKVWRIQVCSVVAVQRCSKRPDIVDC